MTMRFFIPTRVIGGDDVVQRNATRISDLGRRALVVCGRQAARACGALEDITGALQSRGVASALFDEVEPDPHLDTCRKAARIARSMNADFIVAAGGGSALDAAKVASILACNDVDDAALIAGTWTGSVLKVVAIPTTAGTGSEVTPYAIVTNPAIESKSNVSSDRIFPALALLDGRYLNALPLAVMQSTLVDALSHAVEGFLSRRADSFSRMLAADAMRRIAVQLRKVSSEAGLPAPDPADMHERLAAACLAGMVIAHTGTTAVHSLGYSLTYFKGIPHGRANGLVLAACLRFIESEHPLPIRAVLDALELPDTDALRKWMGDILGPMPLLRADERDRFVQIAMKAANRVNTLRIPACEDLHDMLAFSCQNNA
jgi:alcohol dehydrogenase class IV